MQGTVPGNKNAAVEEKTSLEPQGVYIQEYWEETIKISKIYNFEEYTLHGIMSPKDS